MALQCLAHGLQGAQGCCQDQRAPTDHRRRPGHKIGHLRTVPRITGPGQMPRHIQGRLLGIVEWAVNFQNFSIG